MFGPQQCRHIAAVRRLADVVARARAVGAVELEHPAALLALDEVGDDNAAHNVAKVTVRDQVPNGEGAAPAGAEPAASADVVPAIAVPDPVALQATIATASAAGMNAVAQLDGNAARVLLQIDGQGAVEQWINRSGMGQTIMLSSDGQTASNWMELDIVRNTSQARAGVAQNVAQAIALSRGIAVGY